MGGLPASGSELDVHPACPRSLPRAGEQSGAGNSTVRWVSFSADGPQLTLASGSPDSGTWRKNSKQVWVPAGTGPTYDLGVFAFLNVKKIYNFNFHHENNCVFRTSRRPLTCSSFGLPLERENCEIQLLWKQWTGLCLTRGWAQGPREPHLAGFSPSCLRAHLPVPLSSSLHLPVATTLKES